MELNAAKCDPGLLPRESPGDRLLQSVLNCRYRAQVKHSST
jgi:hypothetical protein